MSELFDYLKRWVRYDAETEFYYKHFPSLVETAELVLRPMRRSDLRIVSAIEQLVYEFPWELATFRDCFNVGYNCWVGEKAGQVLTYGICSVGGGEAHVLNLCVAPNNQGRGYGGMMLEKLIDIAKGAGVDALAIIPEYFTEEGNRP